MNILLGGLLAVAAADTLWLQNDRLRLGFDSSNGSLLALTDRASGQSFVDGRAAGIWRLDRLGPGDSRVVPTSARSFSSSQASGRGWRWSGVTSGWTRRLRCVSPPRYGC